MSGSFVPRTRREIAAFNAAVDAAADIFRRVSARALASPTLRAQKKPLWAELFDGFAYDIALLKIMDEPDEPAAAALPAPAPAPLAAEVAA